MFDALFVACGVTAIIATPFMLVNWFRNLARPKAQRSFPLKSVLFFAIRVACGLLIGFTGTFIGELQVLHFLDGVPPDAPVLVNQQKVKNPAEVIAALRELRDLPAHHSEPTHPIRLDIHGRSHLALSLARDSGAFRDLPALIHRYSHGPRGLDFGYGTGRSTRFLRDLGLEVIGADISEAMLRQARELDSSGEYYLLRNGICREFTERSFDVILAAFTFDNMPMDQKADALDGLRDLLAPNGVLFLIVSSPAIYVHEMGIL